MDCDEAADIDHDTALRDLGELRDGRRAPILPEPTNEDGECTYAAPWTRQTR